MGRYELLPEELEELDELDELDEIEAPAASRLDGMPEGKPEGIPQLNKRDCQKVVKLLQAKLVPIAELRQLIRYGDVMAFLRQPQFRTHLNGRTRVCIGGQYYIGRRP